MSLGNAELCSQCGEHMFIVPNPSQEMLQNSEGYQILEKKTLALTGRFDEEDVRMAFCEPCGVTAIIGARVSISGIVVGED